VFVGDDPTLQIRFGVLSMFICLGCAAQTPPRAPAPQTVANTVDARTAMTLWNAFQAGYYYGIALRGSLFPENQERAAVQEHFVQKFRRFAQRVPVTDIPDLPHQTESGDSAYQRGLEVGIARFNAVSVGIAARQGRPVAFASVVGFRVVMAPEYVPMLDPAQQDESMNELRVAIAGSGLPVAPFNPLEPILRAKSSYRKALHEVFAFHDAVIDFLEDQLLQDGAFNRVRTNVWELGTKVCMAALGRSEGAPPDMVERMFDQSVAIAHAIELRLPVIPETGADKAESRATILHYMFSDVGKSLASDIEALYGRGTVAILELAIKSSIALLIYGPEDDMGDALSSAMERAAVKARLPQELWRPLTSAMKGRAPYREVKARVAELQRTVGEFLEAQASRSRLQGPGAG
jgi:hypothetical protein